MKTSLCFLFVLFSLSSQALYNFKTKAKSQPTNMDKKHWLVVSENCHSCSQVLNKLKTFCSGKKPSAKQLGFLISGKDPKAISKKLKHYEKDYEVFVGSHKEFYSSYKLLSTPSLLTKTKKVFTQKSTILDFLKTDHLFCST